MKKKYLIFEFIVVLSLLVLPPLFSKQSETSTQIAFSSASIIQFFIAAALEFQFIYLKKHENNKNQNEYFLYKTSEKKEVTSRTFTSNCFLSFKTLILLCLTAALMTGLNRLFPDFFTTSQVEVSTAKNLKEFAIYIIQIIIAAFYEEELYRQFLPETLLSISNSNTKRTCIIIESIGILIFALSHRYLGIAGVVNAAISGTVLRLYCRKRTTSVFPSFTAHAFYNTILLIISLTIA